MVCSKCGHEIPEGKLMCENCGAEINIVPEFDIEIENSINETLSNIVEEINPEKTNDNITADIKKTNKEKEIVDVKKTKQEKFEEEFFSNILETGESKLGKKALLFIPLSAVVVIGVAIFLTIYFYRNYSVSFQINSAKEAVNKGEFDTATSILQKAQDMEPDDIGVLYEVACVYGQMEDFDTSLEILTDIFNNHIVDNELRRNVIDEIIREYEIIGDYKSIKNIIEQSEDENVIYTYKKYTADTPSFDVPTGTYDSPIMVSLKSDSEGIILYTTDGSTPDQVTGKKYSGPFQLEGGEYLVRAVLLNEFNVFSEEKDAYYLIGPLIPDAPIIYPESGKYDKSITINVVIPDDIRVYYTLDGTEPDPKTSAEYLQPFELGVGNYNVCFISESKDGSLSETVNRSYSVELKANVSEDIAKAVIMNMLKVAKVIDDIDGNDFQNKGKYSLKTDGIIELSDGKFYYKFEEIYTDSNGNASPTGLLYAVSCESGEGFRLGIDTNSQWQLIPIG